MSRGRLPSWRSEGWLRELAPADTEELRAAWQAAAEGTLKEEKERKS